MEGESPGPYAADWSRQTERKLACSSGPVGVWVPFTRTVSVLCLSGLISLQGRGHVEGLNRECQTAQTGVRGQPAVRRQHPGWGAGADNLSRVVWGAGQSLRPQQEKVKCKKYKVGRKEKVQNMDLGLWMERNASALGHSSALLRATASFQMLLLWGRGLCLPRLTGMGLARTGWAWGQYLKVFSARAEQSGGS